ncbi:MAG: hypothetical protein E6Q40_02555 [Cupriavidus sp.]|nr:MAG: hypothetical protein E6Q40_02555 [Cupriavidus sp.]
MRVRGQVPVRQRQPGGLGRAPVCGWRGGGRHRGGCRGGRSGGHGGRRRRRPGLGAAGMPGRQGRHDAQQRSRDHRARRTGDEPRCDRPHRITR